MNVVLIMVLSVNGKITNGHDPDVSRWTSREDQELFSDMKSTFPVIIMGRQTYDDIKHRIQLSANTQRIVLTGNPAAYAKDAVTGQLEFSDETPADLIRRLDESGISSVLLAGGAEIAASFLKEKLIDELHITIEPVLFGTGKNLLTDFDTAVRMKLTSIRQLNPHGSVHLTYTIL